MAVSVPAVTSHQVIDVTAAVLMMSVDVPSLNKLGVNTKLEEDQSGL